MALRTRHPATRALATKPLTQAKETSIIRDALKKEGAFTRVGIDFNGPMLIVRLPGYSNKRMIDNAEQIVRKATGRPKESVYIVARVL